MGPPASERKPGGSGPTQDGAVQPDLHGVFPTSLAPIPRSRKRKATAPLDELPDREDESAGARNRPPTPFPDCVNVSRSRAASDQKVGAPSMILASVAKQIKDIEVSSLEHFAGTKANLREYLQTVAEERESVRSVTADKLVELSTENRRALDRSHRDVDLKILSFLTIAEGLLGRIRKISEDLKSLREERQAGFDRSLSEATERVDRWSDEAKQYSEIAQERANAMYDDSVAQLGHHVTELRAHFDIGKQGLEWVDEKM